MTILSRLRDLARQPIHLPAALQRLDAWDVLLLASAAAVVWGVADVSVPAAKIAAGLLGTFVALRGGNRRSV